MCNFNLAWVGNCKNDSGTEPMCEEHKDLKCDCCGQPATRQCSETFGMICGSNLCDTCEHYITEKGVNYSGCKHVKKGQQEHLPWWMNQVVKDYEDNPEEQPNELNNRVTSLSMIKKWNSEGNSPFINLEP